MMKQYVCSACPQIATKYWTDQLQASGPNKAALPLAICSRPVAASAHKGTVTREIPRGSVAACGPDGLEGF